MNKISVSVILVVSIALAGCATSPREKWDKVAQGQTREEVSAIMGNPQEIYIDNGQSILVWKMDNFEGCGTKMTIDDRVESKRCKDNVEARAQAMQAQSAARAAYWQMRAAQPAPAAYQAPAYQMPIRQQTNCTSNRYGNTIQTNCY